MKRVILKLSPDGKYLLYKKEDERAVNLWDKLKGHGKLALEKIIGIVYGGTTMTFGRLRKNIVKMHAMKREPVKRTFEHYDPRRSIDLLFDKALQEKMFHETVFTEPDALLSDRS